MLFLGQCFQNFITGHCHHVVSAFEIANSQLTPLALKSDCVLEAASALLNVYRDEHAAEAGNEYLMKSFNLDKT